MENTMFIEPLFFFCKSLYNIQNDLTVFVVCIMQLFPSCRILHLYKKIPSSWKWEISKLNIRFKIFEELTFFFFTIKVSGIQNNIWSHWLFTHRNTETFVKISFIYSPPCPTKNAMTEVPFFGMNYTIELIIMADFTYRSLVMFEMDDQV